MPPKLTTLPWVAGGGPPLHARYRQGVHPKEANVAAIVPVANPGGVANAVITVYEYSDINTHAADAVVIATDIAMTRVAEAPYRKFRLLAGQNLELYKPVHHYAWRLDATGINRVYISDLTAATSSVKSPSFRTTTNRWLVFVNVPKFVNGPMANGFRGNGAQLYQCYISAFEAALAPYPAGYAVPPAAIAAGGVALPTTLAFSFMGPAQGWNVQDAALIAMTAIRDATQPPPGGVYPGGTTLNLATFLAIQMRFTNIEICANYEQTHNPIAQSNALQRAFNEIFGGGDAQAPLAPGTVTNLRITRSGARYGKPG